MEAQDLPTRGRRSVQMQGPPELSTLLALFSSCSGKQQGDAPQAGEGFDITGAWVLISQTYPSGRVVETNLKDYSRCKIYGSANQSEDVRKRRAEYGTYIYRRCVTGE